VTSELIIFKVKRVIVEQWIWGGRTLMPLFSLRKEGRKSISRYGPRMNAGGLEK
jgi:hypothetical protein